MVVAIYIYIYGKIIDAQRFTYVRDSGPVATVRNAHGEGKLARHGMWTKLWRHCGSRGMITFRASGKETDITFIRCHEEVGYEQRLNILIRRLMDTEDDKTFDMDAVSEVHLSKVVLDKKMTSTGCAVSTSIGINIRTLRCKCGAKGRMRRC